MLDPAVALAMRAALAILFGTAAWHKLRDPATFRATLDAYDLLPPSLVRPIAVGVIVGECALVAGLVGGAPWAPLGAAAVLVAYAAAVGANLARGRDEIDCGCVGAAGHTGLSWWLVARNLVVAAVAVGLRMPPAGRGLVWLDGITVAGLLATVSALYAAADRLLANRPAVARARGEA